MTLSSAAIEAARAAAVPPPPDRDLSTENICLRITAANQLITDAQERVDYCEMFQHIDAGWKRRYLQALAAVVKVRTDRHDLTLLLDIAQRREVVAQAESRLQAKIERNRALLEGELEQVEVPE